MVKHIIFDFDGTLADSTDIGLQIINELSDKYHYKKMSKEDLRLLNTRPIKERFKMVGVPLYKLPQLVIDGLSRYRELINSLKTYDGIKELIIDLKAKGLFLSIISSNSVENIEGFLKKYELEYFDKIISANSVFGKNKTIKSYLKTFHLQPKDIIYVGDELRDIEACKKVPVEVIAVTWGFDSTDLLKSAKPEYIANIPQDIFEIINKIIT